MEQDKIDLARATPVSEGTVAGAPRQPRRSAPFWLQLFLSLLVISAAVMAAGLFNTTANTMLTQWGVALPYYGPPATAPGGAPGGLPGGGGPGGFPGGGAPGQTAPGGAPAGAPGQGGPGAGQGGAPGPQAQAQTQIQPGAGQQGQAGVGAPQGQAAPGGAPGAGPGRGPGGPGGPGGFGGGNRTAVVVTEPVATGKINDKLTAIGEGSALNAVTVTAPSAGTLTTVDVKAGDRVEAGTKLATLDTANEQNAYDRALLSSRDADAAYARAQTLNSANSLSETQLEAARLAAENAKLALQSAQIALDKRTITTPVAGTVGLIQVSAGNLIGSQTVVTTVQDSSEILVNFWVPERYAPQIAEGMTVNATSAALPGRAFEGTITALDNQIDPASRTLQVQATLPNADGVIRAGMSFSVEMAFPGETFAAVDPLSVQWSNAGAYVWKVVDGRAVKGMVDIVQRNSDGVLVTGDVREGDQIVTQGVLQLSDNIAVRLLEQQGNGGAPPSGGPPGATPQGSPGGQPPAGAFPGGNGGPQGGPANGQRSQFVPGSGPPDGVPPNGARPQPPAGQAG